MPYVEEIMSIGRAANGYVLTVRIPYSEEKEEDYYDGPVDVGGGSREKVILCKDIEDLSGKISSIIPALVDKQSASEAFDNAFKEIENE
jgi:hypothetical protein